jgi:D-alanine--poly(phosphoribitol) ligase subunit 2
MPDPAELLDRIGRVFAAALHLEVPSPDTDLFDTGVLDSLAFVELLLHLEREFGVTTSIDDLEIDNFRTIARIGRFISTREAADRSTSPHPRVVPLGIRR